MIYVQGTIGGYDIHLVDPQSVFNQKQVNLARVNQPNMAGNMYAWAGYSAEPSMVVTSHYLIDEAVKEKMSQFNGLVGTVAKLYLKTHSLGKNITYNARVISVGFRGGPIAGLGEEANWQLVCIWNLELSLTDTDE